MYLMKVMKGAICALAMSLPHVAHAHTAYIVPSVFSSQDADLVTLELAFSEYFSELEVAVKSQDFHFYRPDGARADYDKIITLKQVTLIEQSLTAEGTYRFTTGERLGRKGEMIKIDGAYEPATDGNGAKITPPPGAEIVTSQTETVTDVYVTKGDPSTDVLKARVGRLALVPITHPSRLKVGMPFDLRVTFDGQGGSDYPLTVSKDGGRYLKDYGQQTLKSASDGSVRITPTEPGIYLLMVRLRAEAPENAETDIRSYTTSLTFEVSP